MKVVLENLTKRFPSRNKKEKKETIAADNLNFEIPDGTLVGLLGPSGCGKSTTLKMISGLLAPTSGHIYFGEDDVTDVPPQSRGVGLVFQNYALYPHLTVQQNITFPLENLKGDQKLSKEVMAQKALEVAKLVQIEDLMDRKPSQLSGGQQQRVAIARALVKMPKVLLLDEPLSNLDARLRLQTREEIKRIQQETKITTVFVTHDQEEAMSICDLMVVMKAGAVHQIDKPQNIYDNPINLFVAKFLGTPSINVFNGKVEDGHVFIGQDSVYDVNNIENQEVYIGIRPEGILLNENGRFALNFQRVEVMGRDMSIICTHPESSNVTNRFIIDSTSKVNPVDGIIRFDVKPNKIFLFNKETEERICL